MPKNPQSGSLSSSSSNGGKKKVHKALPPLFWYMEMGDWEKATDRAKRHPREVKTWATLRTKSTADAKVSGTKRLALHHACFKLRSVIPYSRTNSTAEDGFIEVCRFIILLISLYPDAAGMRESRHGCLPLHLAAFASCAPRSKEDGDNDSLASSLTTSSSVSTPRAASRSTSGEKVLSRPATISNRSTSESTTDTSHTNISAIIAEERFTGNQTANVRQREIGIPATRSITPTSSMSRGGNVSVSLKSNVLISAKREDMAVQVINALLDAFPKGIRVDSEGGRLPLHMACAGRATPRVVSTLLTAYPPAARHRNKDGFLPLHLAAHWGVSHPNVAIALLKAYPDSTVGRNRWERTPLEEALCMAGENGRPHQAALIRSLRKHPSYWTRPPEELFRLTTPGRMEGTNVVDIDETLPDDDTTTLEDEERRYFNSGHTPLLEDGSNEHDEFRNNPEKSHDSSISLGSLIKSLNWAAVNARLDLSPQEAGETLSVTTRGGFLATAGLTPLHYACERRPPMEVVESLVAAWPEALTTRMQPGGALPIHVACTWQAPPSAIIALCHAEPAACRIPDDLGNVPLHCASFSGAMAPVVDALLQTYPKAILARNHQGSLSIDIVKRLRHDNRKSVLTLLVARKEEVLAAHHHNRNRSSGSIEQITRAVEIVRTDVSPKKSPDHPQELTDMDEGNDVELNVGVEVSYDENEGDMMWI